jgi:hypothetical protein
MDVENMEIFLLFGVERDGKGVRRKEVLEIKLRVGY